MSEREQNVPLTVAAVLPTSFLGVVAGGMSALVFAMTNDPDDAARALCIAFVCGLAFDWHMQRYGYYAMAGRSQED